MTETMETTAGQAITKLNAEMDAVFVDGNNSAAYLPDVVGDMEDDGTTVIVEWDGGETAILTRMEDGYRAGHYGAVYTVERAEALGY